jgi:hypothetical protein
MSDLDEWELFWDKTHVTEFGDDLAFSFDKPLGLADQEKLMLFLARRFAARARGLLHEQAPRRANV